MNIKKQDNNKVFSMIEKIYNTLDDHEIDDLLRSLHQDLGREASLFCEVCMPNGYLSQSTIKEQKP